ncbi:MAG: sigma-70 family RNA polymerase sigma factor [Candidatus Limnocylindrales bacterium]
MHEELVARAQRGDREAFATLTAGRTNRLYAAARLILRDDEAAADAVQDALVRAWVDLRGLRDPGLFDAWLHRVLIRGCHRAASRSRGRTSREVLAVGQSSSAVPDLQVELAMRDELERGLRRLSHDQRTVLVVRYYLDLPLTECAQVLGLPLGTVQSRISRALQALRAALQAEGRPLALAGEVVA